MFNELRAEIFMMDNQKVHRETELNQSFMKPVQFKLPLMKQILAAFGEMLILAGLKVKERAHTKLTPEPAHAPTFIIML